MFQVQNIALDRALLQLVDGSKVNFDVRSLLEVGKVLNVEIRQNQLTGERGIGLNGQFIPAQLPDSVATGESLSVKVIKSSDAIVLQILPQSPQSPAKLEATIMLDNLLRSVLTGRQLEVLRSIPRLLSPEARIGFPETRSEGGEPVRPGSAADTLARIAASGLFVREEELDTPESLKASLARIGTDKILAGLGEAKSAIQKLARDPLSEMRLALVGAIGDQIDELLGSAETLSFDSPAAGGAQAEKALTNALKLTLAISRYAQESGNLVLVNKLARDLGGLGSRISPISFLLESLLNLESLRLPVQSEADRVVADLVKDITSALLRHRETGAEEGQVRESLVKFKLTIREGFGDTNARLRDEVSVRAAANALQSLEAMANAQEVLNRINPVVQALGEPALILVPALIQGLFNRWDILVPPHLPGTEGEGEGEGGAKNASRESFERLSLVTNLPALGDIKVDLAHRPKELLLNLTVSDERAAEFLRSKLHLLESRLRSNGYERTSLSAVQGEVSDATPGWYRDLIRQGVMA